MATHTYLVDAKARVATLLLACVLGFPAVYGFFDDDKQRSAWEKRDLEPFPSPAILARQPTVFFASVDAYINDHFGFALEFNRLYRRVIFFLFRESPAPNITLGRNGFVFLNSHNQSHPFSAFENLCGSGNQFTLRDKIVDGWLAALSAFQARGFPSVAAIAPTKPGLYPEMLPDSVPARFREACGAYRHRLNPATLLVKRALEQAVKAVYPFDAFWREKNRGNFYPKENFHWSGDSAHLFSEQLLAGIGIQMPAEFRLPGVVMRQTADLANVVGFERIFVQERFDYVPFGLSWTRREPAWVLEYYARAVDFGTIRAERSFTESTALMLSDSFGAFLAPHLAPAFRQITWININHLQPFEAKGVFGDLVDRLSPDLIILLSNDGGMLTKYKIFSHWLGDPSSGPGEGTRQ